MRHWISKVAVASVLLVTSCGGASESGEQGTDSSGEAPATTALADESTSDPVPQEAAVIVDGPNGYTLEVEEFADMANWWYASETVSAVLCGELQADRTLRIYRASDKDNRGGVFCEDGGGTILTFEAGREIEQPDEDGSIEMLNGDIGEITAGGETFGKSGVGTVTVEVGNPADPSTDPAVISAEVVANTGNLMFTFSAPSGSG